MMIALLLSTAAVCLLFAAFCMFGLPWMVMGPRMFDQLVERTDHKAAMAMLAAAAIALACAPVASPVLISPSAGVQVGTSSFPGSGWQA